MKLRQLWVILLNLAAMKCSSAGFHSGYKDEIRMQLLSECACRVFFEGEIERHPTYDVLPSMGFSLFRNLGEQ